MQVFFIFSIWCASIESEVSLSLVVSGADTSVITLPILTPCHVYCFLHHHHQRLIHYGKESHWKAKPPSSDDPGFCLVVADVQKLTVWSTDGLGPRNGRITWQHGGWCGGHRRPVKSQGLWPQEVAAAAARPHQPRNCMTTSSTRSNSRLYNQQLTDILKATIFQLRNYILMPL